MEEENDDEGKQLIDLLDSDEENGGDQKRKTITREERNEKRRLEEEKLRQREMELSQLNRTPKTLEDFQMSVISSPNSSLAWLKYMAYYLDKNELDQARKIGERALNTISFREENEKLNVWIGLLNLEITYGDETSMENLVARAIQFNDPLTIYMQLASIYDQSGQLEKAEQTYQLAMKKHKHEIKKIGIELINFYMKHKRPTQARQLFRQLLLTIEKRDHVEIISKMGLAELKEGNIELGKTVFETMLTTYWRRLDQWSIYLDALVKYTLTQPLQDGAEQSTKISLLEPIEYIRNLYERLMTFDFSLVKMKFLAKRYLQFETQFGGKVGKDDGDKARVERLNKKANEVLSDDTSKW